MRGLVIGLIAVLLGGCSDEGSVNRLTATSDALVPSSPPDASGGGGAGDTAAVPADVEGEDTCAGCGPDTPTNGDAAAPDPQETQGTPDTEAPTELDVPEPPDDTLEIVPPECGSWTEATAEPGTGDDDFPWGITAGAITTTTARLWARLPDAGEVTVRVSAGPECEELLLGPFTVDGDSRVVHVDVDGLLPGRLYAYRFERSGGLGWSSAAWLVTASDEDTPFTVMLAGDVDPNHANAEVMFDAMLVQPAERLIFMGDWPYCDKGGAAVTLEQYRVKHEEARSPESVQDFLAFMPCEANWDDHEVTNDWDAADNPAQVAAGVKAWKEFFPVRGAVEGEVYRRHVLGPEVELFQLDCRWHRDANSAPNDANKTMLGPAQRDWLLDGVRSSDAAFKLVLTSVPLDYGTTGADAWPGFVHERDLLLDTVRDEGISGVIFLTADQHFLSVHDTPWGVKELQIGPTGTFVREWMPQPSEVLFQVATPNAALLEYLPNPSRLVFTAFDAFGDVLYAETLLPGTGSLELNPSQAGATWTVTGAHVFEGKGPATLPNAPEGDYTVIWQALAGYPTPPPQRATLSPGAQVVFSGAYDGPPSLLQEVFDSAALSGWTFVEQGVTDATAAWAVTAGSLRETGNCYDENLGQDVVPKEGTFAWRSAPLPDAVDLTVDVYAGDNDSFGLMWAVSGKDDYVRVSFDHERSFARVVRVQGGQFTVLDERLWYTPPNAQWVTLAVFRRADGVTVVLDGFPVFSLPPDGGGSGGVALYAWGMDDVRFDNLMVYAAE